MKMVSDSKTDQTTLYKELDKSPMFKLSLSSKELFHSNFMEYLSTVDRGAFEKLIEQMAGLENYSWPPNWAVLREYHNFDLCIVDKEPSEQQDDYLIDSASSESQEQASVSQDIIKEKDKDIISDYRILFVIENKVKSIPYEDQLKRYTREAEEQNWRFFGREAKKELNDSKKILKVDNGLWYKLDNKNKWHKWSESDQRWIDDCAPYQESVIKSYKKTEFYDSYINAKIELNKIHFILLSLVTAFPGKPKSTEWTFEGIKLFPPKKEVEGNIKEGDCADRVIDRSWNIIQYSKYVDYIEKSYKNIIYDLDRFVICDYCSFVNKLTSLTIEWERQYGYDNKFLHFRWGEKEPGNGKKEILYKRVDFDEEFICARKHRIHDLYQKTRYSYLCGVLYARVKSIVDQSDYGIEVFPDNQGGLFKTGQERDRKNRNFICVNHTYLHGEPLLEINIHPAFKEQTGTEICFAIQVQGGVFEHGFQVRYWQENTIKNITAGDVWEKHLKMFPNSEEWMRLPKVEDNNADWNKENTGLFYEGILPNKTKRENDLTYITMNEVTGKKTFPGYNKYDMNDSTYIYQSRRIMNDATIQGIIDQMINDTMKVVEWLKDLW